MNVKLIAAVGLMSVGLAGLSPTLAEPFTDQGADWITASPSPNPMTPTQTLPRTPDGAFASSWGGGRTPTQAESRASSSLWATTGSCHWTARAGFNTQNNFPAC